MFQVCFYQLVWSLYVSMSVGIFDDLYLARLYNSGSQNITIIHIYFSGIYATHSFHGNLCHWR